MSQSISLTLECFGELARLMAGETVALELDAPHTPANLIASTQAQYPGAADLLSRTACARGDTLLAADATLADGDVIGLVPPVSGGQPDAPTYVTDAELDLAALMDATEDDECGALVVFGGTVRINNNEREVASIEYTAHGPLATKTLADIEAEAIAKHGARACRIQHRTGKLGLGATSVYVVVRAKHRAQAFDAARYAIETLKQRVAIWKNEHYADGSSEYLRGSEVAASNDEGNAR